jgi:hypothetical protein
MAFCRFQPDKLLPEADHSYRGNYILNPSLTRGGRRWKNVFQSDVGNPEFPEDMQKGGTDENLCVNEASICISRRTWQSG